MRRYSLAPPRRRHVLRRLLLLLAVVVAVMAAGAFAVQRWYYGQLRPVSDATEKHYITIASGSSVTVIAKQLHDAGLIRSAQAFAWYVSVHDDRDKLQAGTYSFTPSQGTAQIADTIAAGRVATDLVTILPGQRVDQVRQAFIKAGFEPVAVDAALSAAQYRLNYPALADNPPGASLEGFLYPDSFEKTATTDPKQIIEESLTEMQQHLTDDIRNGFARKGLTVYQGVTLASIVEQEVSDQEDRNQAAQVFLSRLQLGMPLGSDVTAFYGAIIAGVAPATDYDSPYNTLLHKGFPPGPISNVNDSALNAVAHSATTDWLYFVTGDDGVTHFAKTIDEHNANVSKYCHKLCSRTQ